jgi:methionyl-tRNA formyltransferase
MSAEVLRPRRIVYFGTPDMAVPPLRALVAAGFEVLAVVTRVDKRRGRGGDLLPSPVKRAAEALGLPVLHAVDEALQLGADLGVVVAFGQIVKPHALAVLPMVNLHFSLLPRWRGAAPVERAILAGDEVTGVCLMQVAEGLDTGDVHACVELPIDADETAASLRARLVEAGSTLLVEQLAAGLSEARPQQGQATYAAKVHPDDLRLDWSQPAAIRHRVVRLGGAHTTFRGRRLKVLAAELVDPSAVGDTLVGDTVGGLRLETVQPESKGPMPFAAFANGARPVVDERLGA